jgi:hypothetical protein
MFDCGCEIKLISCHSGKCMIFKVFNANSHILEKMNKWNIDDIDSTLFYENQEFIDEFFHIIEQSNNHRVNDWFEKVKQKLRTTLYSILKPHAYDSSIPDELKIELDGEKFLFTFLDGAISTINKKHYVFYGSKFKFLSTLFEQGTTVFVTKTIENITIDVFRGENLVVHYELQKNDDEQMYENRMIELYQHRDWTIKYPYSRQIKGKEKFEIFCEEEEINFIYEETNNQFFCTIYEKKQKKGSFYVLGNDTAFDDLYFRNMNFTILARLAYLMFYEPPQNFYFL